MKPISRIRGTRTQERRRRRTNDVMEALHLQLDACREDAELEAMVVADDLGMLLASSGMPSMCYEVAARLPILARKAGDFSGVLLGASGGVPVGVKRIKLGDSELIACALGGQQDRHGEQLRRAEQGVKRILAA
jgi:hypothetical protein